MHDICDPMEITYVVASDGQSITFYPCEFTSRHPQDIEQRYCARCHRWMDLVRFAQEARSASRA